ncbi:MAG: L-lactate dehydrogenase [Eubacteriales bacterium]|nr:L-lactate dehydrogenase [Eubacteriales bacterium]
MKKRIVGVIGVGHVGAHVMFNLAVRGIADEIVLVDKNEQKAKSECQDLFDGVQFFPHRVEVRVGDFADLKDCDVVINCTGKIELLVGGTDRNMEMNYTVDAVNGYAKKIADSGFDGILINVTNPCDVITERLARLTGLPDGHVFGTGTGLDSSRLCSVVARATGVDHKSICAYMLGEHGAHQIAAWSSVNIGGLSLDAFEEAKGIKLDRPALQTESIGAGWATFVGKHCTEYAISSTAARLAEIVLHDEKVIMPVSTKLNGEYGEKDVYVGVPAIVGKNGVESVVELKLSAEEKAEFHACCENVRANIKRGDEI